MICVIALIVFAIMGIFSASYRKLAKEAFDCVFKRITFRKCTSGLDQRLKSQITGSVMRKSPGTARFLYKNFELLSWIFLILTFASLVGIGYGVYNYVLFGNCNGPNTDSFCVITKIADTLKPEAQVCSPDGATQQQALTTPDISGVSKTFIGNEQAKVTVIEFGCYSCPFTRKAQPLAEKVINKYKYQVKFIFLHYPIEEHPYSKEAALASICAEQQNKFWQYHEELFKDGALTSERFTAVGLSVGLDMKAFNTCIADTNNVQLANEIALGKKSGVYATPTFFVNNQSLVGLQKESQLEELIESELKK
jgi:protein-disulfide isomerase